ncbi:hypothetical protein PPYR_04680 [Photinus pyralis]|uniref:STAS domain-containing protein n=1 Tax=Photinus pyralis TaxID=7054 RepID=A0A5N4AYT6_PHOPY|nr:solute carrier family 26 member 10-like isoform X2 [Photinus pyralis]KAB0802494.1 hypothetical protein PPYR_04680 [Photinus pyralis]
MNNDLQQRVKIDRPLYDQEQLNKHCQYEKLPKKHLDCVNCTPSRILFKTVPVLKWLPKYRWKENILGDLIAGFTIAIMQIPQGMAYSLLANVPPITGIYTGVFPVLVYFIFGTSKHNSMGTFAVICLMTGKTVLEHSDPSSFNHLASFSEVGYSPIQVATATSFAVAMVMLVMYLFRLGIISTLLSDTLVSGFTTGAACHVFTSQLKDIFGLGIPTQKGYFTIVKTWMVVFEEIKNVNCIALGISVICIIILILFNEGIKPKVAQKCMFPIPVELLLVILGTVCSYFLNLVEDYNVKIVGTVPTGLPEPSLPPFELMGRIMVDSIVIAIVSYALSLSMALIFAQKHNYEVDANQELLAQGVSNVVGSCFSCVPVTASLTRSMMVHAVGGKTQLYSIVSCGILILVLMWMGPLLETLPISVLASIIVVALKGLFIQIKDFVPIWKASKLDAMVWLITFLVVVFVNLDIGLLVGLLLSLAQILLAGFQPYTCLMYAVPNTDIYLDSTRYKMAIPLNGIKIFHYSGNLSFALRNTFKLELYRLVGIQPQKELRMRRKIAKLKEQDDISFGDLNISKFNDKIEKLKSKTTMDVYCIVLDFSAVSYIDSAGVATLKSIVQDFAQISIPIYIASSEGPVYETMSRCKLFNEPKCSIRIFPTVHDAVQSAKSIFSLENHNHISVISKV